MKALKYEKKKIVQSVLNSSYEIWCESRDLRTKIKQTVDNLWILAGKEL